MGTDKKFKLHIVTEFKLLVIPEFETQAGNMPTVTEKVSVEPVEEKKVVKEPQAEVESTTPEEISEDNGHAEDANKESEEKANDETEKDTVDEESENGHATEENTLKRK